MFRQSRLPGGSEGKYILHVGGCTYYKNVEAVIETLSLLVNRWKFKVLLAKVGEEFTQEQKRLIHRHGLEGMVVHLGRVSREELCWLYNAADLLLFPSHYEGFGFPVVEAMACGLPVVTSNVSSLPEVVGDAAITVAPTDYEGMAQAVCAVLTNEELRRTLSGKGLERAQQFSWEKAAKATFRIYQEIHELSCPA
jgi:glycosyltransferase involved in cell wall biosynthesis